MSGRWTILRADVRDAGVLWRTEQRCRLRALRGNSRRLVATAVVALVFLVGFPAMLYGIATAYGRSLASGAVPVGPTGVALSGVAVAGLYLGASSGLTQEGAGNVGPLVRTTVAPVAVSLGRLVTDLTQVGGIAAAVGLVFLGEVAVGAGDPVPAVLLGLAALPIGLAALAVGRVLGTGLRVVNRALQVGLWTKAILYLGLTAGIYFGMYRFILPGVDEGAGPGSILPSAVLPGEPLQAYASVLLAPLGATPRPLGVLVVAVAVALVPIGLATALKLETRLLLADPVGDEDASDVARSRGVPWPLAAVPSGRVAWRYLLRTRRDPRMLAHLGSLLFGLFPIAGSALTDPHMAASIGPASAVIVGAILAGAAYCMNPLGDDRDQLPLLLTSAPSTAVLLRGRAVAGLVIGLAVSLGLGVPSGLIVHSPVAVLAQSIFAVGLAVAGTGTALGIGAVVPRFEQREYMSVERPHPSVVAMMAFMVGGLVVGAVGLFAVWWTLGGVALVDAVIAWVIYLVVVGGIAALGYWYAVRTFDSLVLDEV